MNLPQGWIYAKIPDVVEWSSGGTPKSNNPKYYNGTIPWLIIGDLTDNFVYSSATKITELGMRESNAKYVEKDSVLLAMYGSIGKLGIAGVRLTTNQAIAFTKTLKGINNWYLFYYLQLIKSKLFSLSKGGTQKNISLTVINSLNIPLPPLPEQHRIVAKIDSLFSELDNGVTLLKTIKAQLAVYRQAVLKWAFEGQKFKSIKMMQISDVFGGGAFKSSDFLLSGKYQVIRIGNVRPGIIRYSERPIFLNKLKKNESKYLLEKGDVVITLTGTRKKRDYGFTAVIDKDDLVLNQRVAAIRFYQDYLPKFFLYYSWTNKFKDDFFVGETGNVGQGNVGMKAITETFIPYCSKSEQLAIVSAIESRLSVCDKLEQTIDQTLALSASLRQSILKKAFEGRLVPQDPNDEPAEKLLERIRAQKAAIPAKQKQTRKRGGK